MHRSIFTVSGTRPSDMSSRNEKVKRRGSNSRLPVKTERIQRIPLRTSASKRTLNVAKNSAPQIVTTEEIPAATPEPAKRSPDAVAQRKRLSVPTSDASPRSKIRRASARLEAESVLVRLHAFGDDWEKKRASAQGDIEMYTDENLRQRELLRWHPRILKVLGKWWFACLVDFDGNRNGRIEKGAFLILAPFFTKTHRF